MFFKSLRSFVLNLVLIFFFANNAGAKIVYDQIGEKVVIKDKIKNVVSFTPSITEIIFFLNAQEKLKGTTAFSNYPEEAKEIYKVGTYIKLDIEKILFLKPDLCIASIDGNPKSTVDRLINLKIPVYTLKIQKNIEDVFNTISDIADLLDVKDSKNLDIIKKRYETIKANKLLIKNKTKIFFQINKNPIYAAGKDTLANSLIYDAGGINVVKENKYPKFSKEDVIKLDPQVLIITTMDGKEGQSSKKKWEEFFNSLSIKEKKIYLINSDIVDRPSARIIEGLEKISKIIEENQ